MRARWPRLALTGAMGLFICICFYGAQAAFSPPGRYAETDVKAAFLYQFCNYVEWPAAATGKAAQEPLMIGVIGADEVVTELQRILPGRKVNGRELRVRNIGSPWQLNEEEVLFVGKHARPLLTNIVATVGQRPILIVTEHPKGLEQGAMINFVPADGRLRFELAPLTAQKNGLKFSSRLIPIALRVQETH